MSSSAPSILVIQTAFIGDVILATALIEKLHAQFPNGSIDFLLRKGNEDLLKNHPFIRTVLIWDKKKRKLRNLFSIIRQVRRNRYTYVVNVHRFMSSGLITAFSNASTTIGFDKNPLSFLFRERKKHDIRKGVHETKRNQTLIEGLTDEHPALPKLYPSPDDIAKVRSFMSTSGYICIAPTSVWFTKQFPSEKWVEFLNDPRLEGLTIYVLGAPADREACKAILKGAQRKQIINLAGELSYLQSAALMKGAVMNYVNDSAPLHLASAMDAPVVAIFCSTVPSFGFGPLSGKRHIVEIEEELYCRPCGLHGYKSCPEGHFRCAISITTQQLIKPLFG